MTTTYAGTACTVDDTMSAYALVTERLSSSRDVLARERHVRDILLEKCLRYDPKIMLER